MAKTYALEVLIVLLLGAYISDAWLFRSGSSSSSGNRGSSSSSRSFDIGSQSGLTRLYNQRVVHSEGVRRPLGSGTKMWGPLSHSGTLITVGDGSKWLVHKGDGYGGRGGETVVTSSRHMSNRWRSIPGSDRDVHRSRLGDFVRAGGTGYSLIGDNCHNARCKMSELP